MLTVKLCKNFTHPDNSRSKQWTIAPCDEFNVSEFDGYSSISVVSANGSTLYIVGDYPHHSLENPPYDECYVENIAGKTVYSSRH